jgi:hypothetical protein
MQQQQTTKHQVIGVVDESTGRLRLVQQTEVVLGDILFEVNCPEAGCSFILVSCSGCPVLFRWDDSGDIKPIHLKEAPEDHRQELEEVIKTWDFELLMEYGTEKEIKETLASGID